MPFLIANQQHQTNKRTKAETELLDLLNSIYSTTTWESQCRKGKTSHQHLISQFLQAGRSSCRPTNSVMQRNVMSMWSLRWNFTNKSVAGAPYSIKGYSYSLSHSWTLWWRVRWLKRVSEHWSHTQLTIRALKSHTANHPVSYTHLTLPTIYSV